MLLYHGTNSKVLKNILNNGLKVGLDNLYLKNDLNTLFHNCIYLTNSTFEACKYTTEDARPINTNGELVLPIILEVDVTDENLVPDEIYLNRYLIKDKKVKELKWEIDEDEKECSCDKDDYLMVEDDSKYIDRGYEYWSDVYQKDKSLAFKLLEKFNPTYKDSLLLNESCAHLGNIETNKIKAIRFYFASEWENVGYENNYIRVTNFNEKKINKVIEKCLIKTKEIAEKFEYDESEE